MRQIGIFNGRVQICYAYGRFGWTRNGGKTWHGGIDLVGLDDKTIRMPFYKGKKISGKVTRARIVYNHNDKTWEWGWYVCVQLDVNQTPDTVNFLYFCHCSKLLVTAGQKVSSGDALASPWLTGPIVMICNLAVLLSAGLSIAGRGLTKRSRSTVPGTPSTVPCAY